jgi:hypothetical protein
MATAVASIALLKVCVKESNPFESHRALQKEEKKTNMLLQQKRT